jgi:hypothetical protein
MISRLKMHVVYGESLELFVQADRETIERLRQGIKATIHNIQEEHTYRLSNTSRNKSHGVNHNE